MNGTVLIVDDQPDALMWLYETLQSNGFHVLLANSGELALQSVATALPEVVLLDLMMPDMDGLEVCRRLKAEASTRDIPVLFLSAVDTAEGRIAGFQAGAVDFIQKPFSADEVVLRVQTQCELRRLRVDLETQVRDRTKELESALEDKKMLMRELQHRVKNHLTLVTGLLTLTESSATGKDSPTELLEKARSRVMALAAVYDLLYHPENLTDIDFGDYIHQLVSPWVEETARKQKVISFETLVLPVRLPPDQLIPLGLIVTELVTNALKYAFPTGEGTIVLGLTREGTELVLRVQDNGCGVPDGVPAGEGHGLGWDLVGILTRQLKGQWKFCRDQGTCVEVRFPEP